VMTIFKRWLLSLTILCTAFFATHIAAQDVVLDRIRAVVNEGVVLDSDITAAIRFFKQQAASNRQSLPADSVLSERVLEQLIDREIRDQRAAEIGIAIDANSINRAIQQIARNNNMNSVQFRRTLQQQGFDYDLFRQNIEQDLVMQRLIEREVQPRIRVSAQEIDDFLIGVKSDSQSQQRYRLQHILISVPASATSSDEQEAEAKARTALQELRLGTDFAEVAAALSDGARALQGGDLGWRTLQELPEFLSSAVRNMDAGDLSEPLRSANGFHIIRLAERQRDDQTQLEESLVRHIFIAGDSTDIRRRLTNVRNQLQNGASFDTLAAQISEDPNSADNGGELPWFSQGQMPKEIEDMANSLRTQQISQPFRTQFGWHLMQLLDRRTRAVDDSALREQANGALRQSKIEQETQRWLRQLRDESFVEIRS